MSNSNVTISPECKLINDIVHDLENRGEELPTELLEAQAECEDSQESIPTSRFLSLCPLYKKWVEILEKSENNTVPDWLKDKHTACGGILADDLP